jgi:PEP-CTERM motif
MNTSRTLSLVGLLTLLLLWPAFASAACSPTQVCVATSGTADVSFEFPFNFAGKGFSASGELTEYGNLGNSPFTVAFLQIGSTYDASIAGITGGGLLTQFELTVNGVPWGIPAGGDASVFFSAVLPVTGSSGVTQPFSFEGSFTGAPEPFAPGLGCDVLNCKTLNFAGGGIVFFGLTPHEGGPPSMELAQETFNFGVVPEPSTASLLLLGFAGLAILGWRRRSRPTLIQTG